MKMISNSNSNEEVQVVQECSTSTNENASTNASTDASFSATRSNYTCRVAVLGMSPAFVTDVLRMQALRRWTGWTVPSDPEQYQYQEQKVVSSSSALDIRNKESDPNPNTCLQTNEYHYTTISEFPDTDEHLCTDFSTARGWNAILQSFFQIIILDYSWFQRDYFYTNYGGSGWFYDKVHSKGFIQRFFDWNGEVVILPLDERGDVWREFCLYQDKNHFHFQLLWHHQHPLVKATRLAQNSTEWFSKVPKEFQCKTDENQLRYLQSSDSKNAKHGQNQLCLPASSGVTHIAIYSNANGGKLGRARLEDFIFGDGKGRRSSRSCGIAGKSMTSDYVDWSLWGWSVCGTMPVAEPGSHSLSTEIDTLTPNPANPIDQSSCQYNTGAGDSSAHISTGSDAELKVGACAHEDDDQNTGDIIAKLLFPVPANFPPINEGGKECVNVNAYANKSTCTDVNSTNWKRRRVHEAFVSVDAHELQDWIECELCGKWHCVDSFTLKNIQALAPAPAASLTASIETNWVCCALCEKWRIIPLPLSEANLLPDSWSCGDNIWNIAAASCEFPEDTVDVNASTGGNSEQTVSSQSGSEAGLRKFISQEAQQRQEMQQSKKRVFSCAYFNSSCLTKEEQAQMQNKMQSNSESVNTKSVGASPIVSPVIKCKTVECKAQFLPSSFDANYMSCTACGRLAYSRDVSKGRPCMCTKV